MLLTLRSLFERQPLAAATGSFTATGGDASLTYTPVLTSRQYALGGLFPTYVEESSTRDFVLGAAYVDGTLVGVVNSYSLSVTTGSFTFTGNAATLAIGFPVSTGAFSLTGTATGLRADRKLTVTTGAFALTGNAVTLALGLPVTTGAFSLTGQAASLRADRRLTVTTGAFTLTGQSAGLFAGVTLATSTGAFTLTGNSAALRADRRLTTATGAFTLTGNAVSLVKDHPLAVQTGTFALTGQAASLSVGHVLSAGVGAFTLTGRDADLTAPRVTREYALGGLLPTFVNEAGRRQYILAAAYLSETATPLVAYSLSVSTCAFTLSGNAAGLYRALRAAVTAGAFTLTGNAAGLYRGRLLTAETGAFTLTGQAVSFARTYVLDAATGAFTLVGGAAGLAFSAAEQPAQDTGGGLGPFAKRRRRSRLLPGGRDADRVEAGRADADRVEASHASETIKLPDRGADFSIPAGGEKIDAVRQVGAPAGLSVLDESARLPQPDGHDVRGADDRRSGDQAAKEIPPGEYLAHEPILLDQVTNDNDDFLLLAA